VASGRVLCHAPERQGRRIRRSLSSPRLARPDARNQRIGGVGSPPLVGAVRAPSRASLLAQSTLLALRLAHARVPRVAGKLSAAPSSPSECQTRCLSMSETASRCSSSLSIDWGGSCGTWRRLRHLQTLHRTVCSLGSRSARFRTLGAATIILCVVARNGYDSRCGKLDTDVPSARADEGSLTPRATVAELKGGSADARWCQAAQE
jgi:hypothetical protein